MAIFPHFHTDPIAIPYYLLNIRFSSHYNNYLLDTLRIPAMMKSATNFGPFQVFIPLCSSAFGTAFGDGFGVHAPSNEHSCRKLYFCGNWFTYGGFPGLFTCNAASQVMFVSFYAWNTCTYHKHPKMWRFEWVITSLAITNPLYTTILEVFWNRGTPFKPLKGTNFPHFPISSTPRTRQRAAWAMPDVRSWCTVCRRGQKRDTNWGFKHLMVS